MERVKTFFRGLAHHWVLTIVFILVVVVFVGQTIASTYEQIRSKLPFLPPSQGLR